MQQRSRGLAGTFLVPDEVMVSFSWWAQGQITQTEKSFKRPCVVSSRTPLLAVSKWTKASINENPHQSVLSSHGPGNSGRFPQLAWWPARFESCCVRLHVLYWPRAKTGSQTVLCWVSKEYTARFLQLHVDQGVRNLEARLSCVSGMGFQRSTRSVSLKLEEHQLLIKERNPLPTCEVLCYILSVVGIHWSTFCCGYIGKCSWPKGTCGLDPNRDFSSRWCRFLHVPIWHTWNQVGKFKSEFHWWGFFSAWDTISFWPPAKLLHNTWSRHKNPWAVHHNLQTFVLPDRRIQADPTISSSNTNLWTQIKRRTRKQGGANKFANCCLAPRNWGFCMQQANFQWPLRASPNWCCLMTSCSALFLGQTTDSFVYSLASSTKSTTCFTGGGRSCL